MNPPFLKVGWKVSTKDIRGIVEAIEESSTFKTWCYKVSNGKRYLWVYETDESLRCSRLRFGRVPKPPPLPPDPIFISE